MRDMAMMAVVGGGTLAMRSIFIVGWDFDHRIVLDPEAADDGYPRELGALAANVHGRGLAMTPFIGDVESFVLVDAAGEARRCSRTENADLFRLAIGGYGLFGAIASVTLKLSRRRKLERITFYAQSALCRWKIILD